MFDDVRTQLQWSEADGQDAQEERVLRCTSRAQDLSVHGMERVQFADPVTNTQNHCNVYWINDTSQQCSYVC